jgi:hypothetical protein
MKLHELNIPLQSKNDQRKMFDKDSYCPECGGDVVDDGCTECDWYNGTNPGVGGNNPEGGL